MSNISIPKIADFDRPYRPSNPSETPDYLIRNNRFFPDISLLEIRNAMRIDGTVTNERLKHSAIEAIQTVNRDLKHFREQAELSEIFSLAECDEEEIDGQRTIVYRYKRAVFCLTAANLYERYRSFDSTKEGGNKADQLSDTAGDLKRDYHFAIRDILGGERMIVELV